MKRERFASFLIFLFIFVFIANCFFSCSQQEVEEEITIDNNVTNEIKTVELTKYNCDSYFYINIRQIAQIPTLIYNTYYVEYRYGTGSYWETYTGPTAPTGRDVIKSIYLYGTYSITTTFSVSAYTKSQSYTFSNAHFSLQYRESSSKISVVTVYLDKGGSGSNVFMITEKINSSSKTYSFVANKMLSDCEGKVSFVLEN